MMACLLFGVGAMDVATYGVASAVVVMVAGVACYVQARRASRIEPMVALKYE